MKRGPRFPPKERDKIGQTMGRTSYAHHDLPASDDPVWVQLGKEILENLDTPKTVRQLKDWAKDERLEIGRLVNALAWLDMRGLATVDKTSVEPLWSRSDPKTRQRVPKPLPTHCAHCNGLMKVEPQRLACIVCGRSIYPPVLTESEEDQY